MRTLNRTAARGGVIAAAAALLLDGCAAAPDAPVETDDSAAPAVDISPCIVSDEGGFDDRSFNQLSAEGLQAAAASLGVEGREVQSNSESDYAPNLANVIEQG